MTTHQTVLSNINNHKLVYGKTLNGYDSYMIYYNDRCKYRLIDPKHINPLITRKNADAQIIKKFLLMYNKNHSSMSIT